jgi:hypothetical protein
METFHLGVAALSSLIILAMIASCGKGTTEDVETLIIENQKRVLDEWGKGRTMVFPDNSAAEITYFDTSLEKRLDGKEAFPALCKYVEGKFTVDRCDMIAPKAQVYGKVAILTYNLIDYSERQRAPKRRSHGTAPRCITRREVTDESFIRTGRSRNRISLNRIDTSC